MADRNSPILLIFDLDGTLANTGGVGRKTFELTFYEMYGITNAAGGVKPAGKTDQLIFEELLKRNSVVYIDFAQEFKQFSKHYIANFKMLFAKSDKPFIYDGVKTLLERLWMTNNVYMVLGTGNLRETATVHLQKHGISKYFPTGGFSNNVKQRPQLIKRAFDNAVDHYRVPFKPEQTWVIGDTPSDIAAGKVNGFHTLALGSGKFTIDELREHNPEALLDDLTDSEKFLSIVSKADTI